ncbi:MAG TPA: alpha/beta hydrolase [Mycobacterium sp.]|nr:alpha/beta hydrolase [Mycobacterium sp.]
MRMNPALAQSTMLSRLGDALSSHSTNEPLAVATEWGIRNEALMRRAVDLQLSLGTAVTGIETTATRRRRREFTEAAQFHNAPGQRGAALRPAVNWHEGGDGPALMLLNGSTASGLVWPDWWLRRLEKRYRVIRVDNRGTGWSRCAPHPFTIGDLADDARNVLRACGIGRATVLGMSLGGMIAQEFALRHPKAVERLVLVATRPPTPAQIPSPSDALLSLMRTPPPGEDLRAFFVATWSTLVADGFAAQHPEVMAEVAEQIVRRVTQRRAVLNQARAIWSWHGAARLRRIDAPTTVVHGDRDPPLTVGNGMRLARLIPDATYLELPGIGHLVPQEAGDLLLHVLES